MCRVIDGSLLLRTQKIVGTEYDDDGDGMVDYPKWSAFAIYPHIPWMRLVEIETWGVSTRGMSVSIGDWKRRAVEEDWGKLQQCRYCWTEYRVDVVVNWKKKGTVAVVMTSWKDVGVRCEVVGACEGSAFVDADGDGDMEGGGNGSGV